MSSTTSPVNSVKLRSQKFKQRQSAWKRLRTQFKALEESGEMRYDKVLGAGGFGLVQKWITNEPKIQGRDHSIALKTLIRASNVRAVNALKREVFWMKQFTGCEHLVQLVDLPGYTEFENVNNEDCWGLPVIAMEEFGSGSLELLMSRLRQVKRLNSQVPEECKEIRAMEYIPNRALWSIFLCLVRASIGIAYPPEDPASRKGQVVRETMYDVPPGATASRIIHSDIDIYNTFIGYPKGNNKDFQIRRRWDAEHVWHPIVKIADYGCMVKWDYEWSREQKRNSLWGKRAYKAPEQFDPNGNFGTYTNIYQIGQIMHDLITLAPIPYSGRVCIEVQLTTGEQYTYGSRVVDPSLTADHDWRKVDRELREVVAGCMCLDNIWRPTLKHLEDLCTGRILQMDRAAGEARRGQSPSRPVWNPTPAEAETMYKTRAPAGLIEPDSLLQKFYNEYFVEEWEDKPDKFADYWSKDTLDSDCYIVNPPPAPPQARAPVAGLGDGLGALPPPPAPPAPPRVGPYFAPVANLPTGPPPPRPPRPETLPTLPDAASMPDSMSDTPPRPDAVTDRMAYDYDAENSPGGAPL